MTRAANIDLPKRIIAEATQVVVESGYQAINMRRLAERVGVSATAIYHYFESKESLLRRLRLDAAELLNDRIRPIDEGLAPHDYLAELGRQYVGFAEANPNLYQLLFEAPFDERAEKEDHPVLYYTYVAARGALERMSRSTGLTFEPRYSAMAGWIMLHGFCSLMMSGLLPPAEGLSREMLRQAFFAMYSQGGPPPGK
jgi:AcrR family transcriptional regulator